MPRNRRRRIGRERASSFVMIGRGMLLRVNEWKELSAAAKIIYIYLKAKFNGHNNGQIRLYYSELRGVKGISSPSTISRAFQELEEKEWIRRTNLGGLYRRINEYGLTGRYDDHIIER